ncbi:hypothetical protein E4U41_004103 [Claviceps citrina]|nr:hypothetical protein E4U41_004103 [Claviceps citrina]
MSIRARRAVAQRKVVALGPLHSPVHFPTPPRPDVPDVLCFMQQSASPPIRQSGSFPLRIFVPSETQSSHATMVSADRQLIIETNRSLRNIKTELESLLEKGVIDESIFDEIHAALPQESPLSGPLRTAAARASGSTSNDVSSPPGPPPTQQLQNLGINTQASPPPPPPSSSPAPAPVPASSTPGPPSYDATPAPRLPSRSGKPVLAHARALYRYVASDNRDVSFEKDDKILVHEYMNQDWWMGQNARTQQEGIFPRSYVFVEHEGQQKSVSPAPFGAAPYAQPQYGYSPAGQGPLPPPQQQNPYNSSVPPMAVAGSVQDGHGAEAQQGEGGKVNQYGKKFGKKLGNAAIFGAGATIGGNLVNSIF